ncbi:class I SAM-dependent methyltransferase [Coriobacteriales bacterium OH1046]|nr:class I SAM-dependent methyltransferase [Coriobacteriales bacterium OH1046]
MGSLPYWNHNAAYYAWVRSEVATCSSILDVGCGNGALARYLSTGGNRIVGIDPAQGCIERARALSSGDVRVVFECVPFSSYQAPPESFDAILFVASLHHMDAAEALGKAKSLLASGGKIVIVGLASPSSLLDWAVEALRAIPCRISSAIHRENSSEKLEIPTSYKFPAMSDVRALAGRMLPGARLRHGLHYRYLLTWTKR